MSDLIIAPEYEPAALETLASKRSGRYLVLEIDPDCEPTTNDMGAQRVEVYPVPGGS